MRRITLVIVASIQKGHSYMSTYCLAHTGHSVSNLFLSNPFLKPLKDVWLSALLIPVLWGRRLPVTVVSLSCAGITDTTVPNALNAPPVKYSWYFILS